MVTKTKRTKSEQVEQVEQVAGLTQQSLIPALAELERMVDYAKQDMDFQDMKITVVIQTQGKRACYGHFTEAKIWTDGKGNESHEIQISAEHLLRGGWAIFATVRHELNHGKNCELGVKDTSNDGRYHNKIWLVSSTQYGLDCEEKNKINGYGITKGLSPWYKAIVEQEFQPNEEAFSLVRKQLAAKVKTKAKVKLHKFVCECQGNAGRFPKVETNATCDDCEEKFVHACEEC